jgi:hypothetical protein
LSWDGTIALGFFLDSVLEMIQMLLPMIALMDIPVPAEFHCEND